MERKALDMIAVEPVRIIAGGRAHTDHLSDLACSPWLAVRESGA
jgi:hypothetical protein